MPARARAAVPVLYPSGAAAAASPADKQAALNAAKPCQAERKSIGDAAFTTTYHTNASKSNVFGKCVAKPAAARKG